MTIMFNHHKITAQIKQQVIAVDSQILYSHIALLYLVCCTMVHVVLSMSVKVTSIAPGQSPDWIIAAEETLKYLTERSYKSPILQQ